MQQDRPGAEWLESLGDLIRNRLDMNQECVLAVIKVTTYQHELVGV